MITIDDLIKQFNLKPHPEGGYFAEIYKSSELIDSKSLPKRYEGNRSFSTSIYFLIPEGKKSSLHRLKSDEIWHFYLGGPLTLVEIYPDGKVKEVVIGQDIKSGQKLQYVIKAGNWFGAYPNFESKFSFIGCTVAPGFEFNDFEMGNRDQLIKQFPKAQKIIEVLASPSL